MGDRKAPTPAPQLPPPGVGPIPVNVTATVGEIAAAFTEWERRYREEPDRFMSEVTKLLTTTPTDYGQACAPYFVSILHEQRTS